ncbi:unnamed protein product, partial [Discosporangium mesarthrocarpum]
CSHLPSGTYSSSGSAECSPCPSGLSSPANALSCDSCAPGTYSLNSSSSECLACPAGTYAPFAQAGAYLRCPRGQYSDESSTSCSPCPAGTVGVSVSGGDLNAACSVCGEGSFSSEEGSVSCAACPAGTASTVVGAVNSTDCKTCPQGRYSLAGAGKCEVCPAGHYGPGEGASACEPCPVGKYFNGTGAVSEEQCELCPEGFYTSRNNGSMSIDDCLPCPPGTHSLRLEEGGGCRNCPRGEYTSTPSEARHYNCSECSGGFYVSSVGLSSCSACDTEAFSYNGYPQCVACDFNATCPAGPAGAVCSGHGKCDLGLCNCDAGFNGVDCSNGTCMSCPGVFGFDFESASAAAIVAESAGVVNLTVVRLVGSEGNVTVMVSDVGGNASAGVDYNGTWPAQARNPSPLKFSSSNTKSTLSFPLLDDNVPDEACGTLILQISEVSGGGKTASAAGSGGVGGIHDLQEFTTLVIAEDDFSSTIVEAIPHEGSEGRGGISPIFAEIYIANTSAPYYSDIPLRINATVPTNKSSSLGLDLLVIVEANASMSAHLSRLSELMPGLVAEASTSGYSKPQVGIASFTAKPGLPVGLGSGAPDAYEYNMSLALTDNAHHIRQAVENIAAELRPLVAAEGKGSQLTSLFMAAKDYNQTGWRDGKFRVAAVVTGSEFAMADNGTLNNLDSSSDPLEDYVSVADLAAELSASAIHPLFVLTTNNASLVGLYQDLVEGLGFGAVVTVDEDMASESSYYKHYMPSALLEGLEVLYAQAILFVKLDPMGFVASVSPSNGPSRNVSAGSTVEFELTISASNTSDASSPSGGKVIVSFQGHEASATVSRKRSMCTTAGRERTSGAEMNALDASRLGWLDGFYEDEPTAWVYSSNVSVVETQGPFGVSVSALNFSCPDECRIEEAHLDFSLEAQSQMPLVLKAYTKGNGGIGVDWGGSAMLDVVYSDGSSEDGVLSFDLEANSELWKQAFAAVYPTKLITGGRVTLSFSGAGSALLAGVGLFAHPTTACRCGEGFFLDTDSAPAKLCDTQPTCRFFEGDCNYCEAGYKCPQV